jgi:threonyl-tRNA synthetase
LSLAGAYWRGDEKNAQLTRIYGTCFPTKDELEKHLKNLEEAKLRDHRTLGPQLGLVDIYHEEAGAGLVFYLPNGALLRRTIEDWEIKEHYKRGYQMVTTPHIMDKKLWQKSGHWDYYQENMYTITKDNQEYVLKPMNCPGHILIYKSQGRSYRDLPLRLFELGTVYRFEKSGVLHGLLRVRGFTQDDAHIFCKKEDLNTEIEGVLDFVKDTMDKFGFKEYSAELSTRPEKFIGDKADWDLAEKILEEILKKKNINYQINAGDGAFYGPKIDIKLKDALGRSWQCATVQLDYALPKRFEMTYRAASGEDVQPVMIHRVLLGSLERFLATLIEHYGGRFPFWLAPVQIAIITISQEVKEYALALKEKLYSENFRVEADIRDETMQKKIRDKEIQKVPYILVVGNREKEEGTVSVRKSGKENLGSMKTEDFIGMLKKEA